MKNEVIISLIVNKTLGQDYGPKYTVNSMFVYCFFIS